MTEANLQTTKSKKSTKHSPSPTWKYDTTSPPNSPRTSPKSSTRPPTPTKPTPPNYTKKSTSHIPTSLHRKSQSHSNQTNNRPRMSTWPRLTSRFSSSGTGFGLWTSIRNTTPSSVVCLAPCLKTNCSNQTSSSAQCSFWAGWTPLKWRSQGFWTVSQSMKTKRQRSITIRSTASATPTVS